MDDAAPRPLLTRRLNRTHLIMLDAACAVGLTLFLAAVAVEPLATRDFAGPAWQAWLVAAAIGLPLAVRRRWPLATLGAVLAGVLLATLLGIAWGPSGTLFGIVPAVVLHAIALVEPKRRSVPALVICLLATTGMLLIVGTGPSSQPNQETADTLSMSLFNVLVMGAAWTIGRSVRERRAYAARTAEQLARQAVTEERLQIARELHDVVSHSMSLIAVKAGIANHVAEQRPEEARDALRVIEATSRGALTEMRRMLGVLRPGADEPADRGPAPAVAGLPDLTERAAMAGVRVDLAVRAPDLPDAVGLTVYRIVQEALTNVVKHAAPAACAVKVEADGREVLIEVTDDGPGGRVLPGGQGHGLIGMRERVMMYGGTFTAGPRPTGGFAVSARLPYDPAEAVS